MQKISPCLWFNGNGEEAVEFYRTVFSDLKVLRTTRYGDAGREHHSMAPGTILTITIEVKGQEFTILNAGPEFKFNEAISLQIFCDTQEELDHYWNKLSEGGDPSSQICGWLKDKFGLSWQIVPSILPELLAEEDPAKSNRVMTAVFEMSKLDIAALKKAAEG